MAPCQQATLSRQLIFEEISRQSANVFLEDSHGFIWIGGSRLYRFDGYSAKPYETMANDSTELETGAVYALLEDSQKRIWVGANKGLFVYDRQTDRFTARWNKTTRSARGFGVLSVFEDAQHRIWFGNETQLFVLENPDVNEPRSIAGINLAVNLQAQIGVCAIRADRSGNIYAATGDGLWQVDMDFTARQLLPEKWQNQPAELNIMGMAADSNSMLWLATSDGLWLFDPENSLFTKKNIPPSAGIVFEYVWVEKNGTVWLGTSNLGLVSYGPKGYAHYVHDYTNPYSLIDHKVSSLLFDRFGNLWIGTGGGINRINFTQQQFPFYQFYPGPQHRWNYVHRVIRDSLGGFWFRLMRTGLAYSPGLGAEYEILLQPTANANIGEIKHFCLDADGNVWVLTLTRGLYKFEKGQKKPRHIPLGDSLRTAYALAILADRTDDRYLWFSSVYGLCRVNRHSHQRKWFYPTKNLPWLDNNTATAIVQTEDGAIWHTSLYKGKPIIVCFDKVLEKFTAEPDSPGHPSSIRYPGTRQYQSLPGNKLWVGVRNGLIQIDATAKTGILLTRENGFPLKEVLSITPDLEGNIWFTGDGKICKYDGSTYQCQTAGPGIENFSYWSAALGKDGRLTFGGTNGFYSFYPNEIEFSTDTAYPKVYLTNFKVFNKKRRLGTAYELVKTITIPYEENVLEFEFSALHFLKADRIRYRHRLLGFDKNWVETNSDERRAIYTNLSPGIYTFEVIAGNADGVWTPLDKALRIELTIRPPWYRTCWAWSFYLLAAGAILFTIRRYELRRQLAKAEVRQLKEIDTVKTRLYTNITHEFRTPLTIILGMADQMTNEPKQWFQEGIRMIRRNGRHLLRLVNQMLDLAKIESGNMPLQMTNGDVVHYLRYIVESFHSFAEAKGINIHFTSAESSFHMDFDPGKLLDIVSNLLSNAVKYTPENGDVYIHLRTTGDKGQSLLELKITDTGIGIAENELERIFDRFYQGDDTHTRKAEGTGIGLALTKELVKLLGGEIRAESRKGEGSTFVVLLPVRQEAQALGQESDIQIKDQVEPFAETATIDAVNTAATYKTGQPLLLIIEDNQDVARYLISCLQENYQLVTAANGQQGIDKAIELVPDLIISDVMMPEKDGFEVCRTLKQDERTSHIPIVLLTAKADMDSKLEGLELGADAYLSKPFNRKELEIRLKKLIDLRRALQKRYSNYLTAGPESAGKYPREDEFLNKIRRLVEENISDADYGLVELCKALYMSRSQLFRKLKALTDKSTSIFIRSIRLQKARELLRNTDLNVSEIAYDTGFTSPAYFTRVFIEEFGVAPSEMR